MSYQKDKEDVKKTLNQMLRLCDDPTYVYIFKDVLALGWEEYKRQQKEKGESYADIPQMDKQRKT